MTRQLNDYLQAANRKNTRDSYRAAVQHFEVEWGGFLPATPDSIARYLAAYASVHAANTLRQRVAALAQWHITQGFPDPTKAPIVRQVLRGIRALHPAQEKQARPLQLEVLAAADHALQRAIASTLERGNAKPPLRQLRNRALLLMGFWRGFRGDELTRLRVEHIQVFPDEGMVCYLPRTKNDRGNQGTTYRTPALSRLCPVDAYVAWVSAAQLDEGPVFRGIDRWGNIGTQGIHEDSVAPVLRSLLRDAGIAEHEMYSAHSLRRGFANWAHSNGWDIKMLMEYVGWKHVQTAMRYIEGRDPFAQHRIETSLMKNQGIPPFPSVP